MVQFSLGSEEVSIEMAAGEENTEVQAVRMSQLDELEEIRREGNKLFAERNWTGAIGKYSHCINSAGGPMDVEHNMVKASANAFHSVADLALNTILAYSYSNRAEARLRLRDYMDALDDAERALNIDPFHKHVKSWVRKGKAAHGLELYEKACEAFRCGLEQSRKARSEASKAYERPLEESQEERSIRKILKESSIAAEQSQTGNYDLTDFYSRDCKGKIPSCADYVGPVEIRQVLSGDRYRGLFATKSLEPGELLLVSNPLAVARQKVGTLNVPEKRFPENLTLELVDRIRRSNLQLVRFSFLASDGVPSMELFRPGNGWIPPGGVDEKLDVNYIRETASKNMFHYAIEPSQFEDGANTEVAGLWVLPAFAKHSCAPNCQHLFVGETIFFRASRHMTEGEELTVSYKSDWLEYVTERQECSDNWMFTCKCERCLFERTLPPQLSKMYEAAERKREEAYRLSGGTSEFDHAIAIAKLGEAADEVEAVIQSLHATLAAKEQSWIRASFFSLYLARLMVPGLFSITALRSIVDAEASVYLTPKFKTYAAWLLLEVEQSYSRNSQCYRDTLDQVLCMFRVYFGKLPDRFLYSLVIDNFPPDCTEEFKKVLKQRGP